MDNVIKILTDRGFIEASTSDELVDLCKKPQRIYCGFDPTSDSLHLGNLVGIMGLAWFQQCGHTPVAIVGGATGMIGDPSGKSSERQLLDEDSLKRNLAGITENLRAILQFDVSNAPIILNNYEWFKEFSFIDFLRNVGKHFRLGSMLAKDSVRARLNSEEGMSFTEFSYQLLQAYDFYYLQKNYEVSIQIGGSDQWGNITAGTDFVRRLNGSQVYGLTFPLLTRSDGQKFGKSEKGAIWLSPKKLSSYEFYQHLYRVSDEDVIKLLKMLTFLPIEEIVSLEKAMSRSDYVPNSAQKKLAEEVTRIVHGEEGLQTALKVTQGAAPGSQTVLDAEMLEVIARDMPSATLSHNKVSGQLLLDLIVQVGLQPSKGAVRRLIKNGGVYLNNAKVTDESYVLEKEDLIDDRFLILAVGKKNKLLVKIA